MRVAALLILVSVLVITIFSNDAFAIPIFQVYIKEATADDWGLDKDSWFSFSNPFTLVVVGAYNNKNIRNITGVTLLISIPEDEIGTINFVTSDEAPVLLRTSNSKNPKADADTDILTDVSGDDGYSKKNFFPTGVNFNHYPVKNNISDFLIYSLGNFNKEDTTLYDYNADTGNINSITKKNPWGEQKEYLVSYSGFYQLHFDVYGLVSYKRGCSTWKRWKQNPGSHDSTAIIPEPATLSLLGLGLLGLVSAKLKSKNSKLQRKA